MSYFVAFHTRDTGLFSFPALSFLAVFSVFLETKSTESVVLVPITVCTCKPDEHVLISSNYSFCSKRVINI